MSYSHARESGESGPIYEDEDADGGTHTADGACGADVIIE